MDVVMLLVEQNVLLNDVRRKFPEETKFDIKYKNIFIYVFLGGKFGVLILNMGTMSLHT